MANWPRSKTYKVEEPNIDGLTGKEVMKMTTKQINSSFEGISQTVNIPLVDFQELLKDISDVVDNATFMSDNIINAKLPENIELHMNAVEFRNNVRELIRTIFNICNSVGVPGLGAELAREDTHEDAREGTKAPA